MTAKHDFVEGDRARIVSGGHEECVGTVLEDGGRSWVFMSVDGRLKRGLFHRLQVEHLDVISQLGDLA